MDDFTINTKTTGFASPARSYVGRRLEPNDLLIDDIFTTFFFVWDGVPKLGLESGDHLVVDKGAKPLPKDLVVFTDGDKLGVDKFENINPDALWGTITWKLCRIKK